MERSSFNQLINRNTVLKTRIDADERFGPETIAGVKRFDLATDVDRSNLGKRTGEPFVVVYEHPIEVKDIHN